MSSKNVSPDIASEAELQLPVPTRVQLIDQYLKQDDVVCRAFLKQGTNPADFQAVRLFFPFLRELTACQAPRSWDRVSDCQFFAYYAGHDLGFRHPELQDDV